MRDADIVCAIREATTSCGAVVSFTITTPDDDLSRKLEPGAPPSSTRVVALEALAARGLWVGVTLMPVLPFIEDDEDSIRRLVARAAECGAKYVIPAWGMTLRNQQRAYYYEELDRHFSGLRKEDERAYGDRYSASPPTSCRLERAFNELALQYELARSIPPYETSDGKQRPLF